MQHQGDISRVVTVSASVRLVLGVASPIVVLFLFATLPIFEDHAMGGFQDVAGLQEGALTPIVIGYGPIIGGDQHGIADIPQDSRPRVEMRGQLIGGEDREAVCDSRSLNQLFQQRQPLFAQTRPAFVRCRRGRHLAESVYRCSI